MHLLLKYKVSDLLEAHSRLLRKEKTQSKEIKQQPC